MNNVINTFLNRTVTRAWKGYGTALFMDFENGDWICNQADQWTFLENHLRKANSESSDDEMVRVCSILSGNTIVGIGITAEDPGSTRVTIEFSTGHVLKAKIWKGDSGCGITFHEKATDRCVLDLSYEDGP